MNATEGSFGPLMLALTIRQQLWVIELFANGGEGNDATRAAYPGTHTEGGVRLQTHRNMHNPAVQAAMKEYVMGLVISDSPQNLAVIRKIRSTEGHRDQFKAAKSLLALGGIVERQIIEHTGTVTLTYEQKIARIKELKQLTGETVIEGEFEEVDPELAEIL